MTGDSGSSSVNARGTSNAEKRLKLAEEKNEALSTLVKQKEEEMQKFIHQKNTLTALFERDLLEMAGNAA